MKKLWSQTMPFWLRNDFWVFATHCGWVSSSFLLCILDELAGEGSVDVVVGLSDM